MIKSLRNRIFDNLNNYQRPNEVEYTATQLKAFEILNRTVPKKLTASQQKAHDILNKPKLTLAQMKARKVLDKPKLTNQELLAKCLEVLTKSNEL